MTNITWQDVAMMAVMMVGLAILIFAMSIREINISYKPKKKVTNQQKEK